MPEALLLVTGKPYKGLDTGATTSQIHDLGIESSVRTRFEQVDPVDANAYYRAADESSCRITTSARAASCAMPTTRLAR